MADTIPAYPPKKQSKAEIRVWDVDYTRDLRTGVTVSSAVATHVPPSGSAFTPVVGTISANIVPVSLGPLTVLGTHYLIVTATLSDAQKSEVRIEIKVDY